MDFIYNMGLVLFGEKECKFYTEPENAHPQRHTHSRATRTRNFGQVVINNNNNTYPKGNKIHCFFLYVVDGFFFFFNNNNNLGQSLSFPFLLSTGYARGVQFINPNSLVLGDE